jgi:ankyrin repeat protein
VTGLAAALKRRLLKRLFEAADRGDLGVVRRIIEAQPEWLNFPITRGSCLTIAVQRDHYELAEWLLSVDADPEVPSMEYSLTPCTPLQIATFLGRRRMVELLLKWGAEPDGRYQRNESPWSLAAHSVRADWAGLLLTETSHPEARPQGDTLLHLAARLGLPEVAGRRVK